MSSSYKQHFQPYPDETLAHPGHRHDNPNDQFHPHMNLLSGKLDSAKPNSSNEPAVVIDPYKINKPLAANHNRA